MVYDMKKIAILVMILFCSSFVNATELSATLKRLYVNPSGLVLFSLNKDFANKPSCNTNLMWQFAFSLESSYGKELYSTLLSSYMAKKEVRIGFTESDSNCFSGFPSVNVSYIYLND